MYPPMFEHCTDVRSLNSDCFINILYSRKLAGNIQKAGAHSNYNKIIPGVTHWMDAELVDSQSPRLMFLIPW